MADRQRLIELLSGHYMNTMSDVEDVADDLLANGAIVPPCKVGDRVYSLRGRIIEPCEVEGIYYTRRKNYVKIRPFHQTYIGNWSVYYTPSISSFGKAVFRTLEEAEEVRNANDKNM